MAGSVDVGREKARPLAALRVRATSLTLANVIGPAFDKVYAALGGYARETMGHNVVFYPDGAGLMTPEGAFIYCGVEIKVPFADLKMAFQDKGIHEEGVQVEGGQGKVAPAQTPAGAAAHCVYLGAYAGLGGAHQEVHRYCAANGHKFTGVNWEVYGDWTDDPQRLRTDVYYQLA